MDRRVRLKATTLTEARIEHAQYRADPAMVVGEGPPAPAEANLELRSSPTLRDFVPVYLKRARLSKRAGTVATEKIHLDHWLRGEL